MQSTSADSSIQRGCLSDLTPVEHSRCDLDQKGCKVCEGANCNNRHEFQQCVRCNSTENVDCVRAIHWFDPVTCRAYDDVCYTHVANDVVTRGCLQESTNVNISIECNNPDICEKCVDQAGCNNKIVDGEFCMTCDSNTNPDCRANLTIDFRTQCSLAVTPLGCYRFEDNDDSVRRGCLSDVHAEEREMCRRHSENCKTCFGDDCNTRISFQKCHVCNSTASVDCIRNPRSFPVVTCRDYLDECFTHVNHDVVERGCLREAAISNDALTQECENRDLCEKCVDEAQCNSRIVDGEFCITCDSDDDPDCRDKVSYGMRTQCPLAVRPLGCYRLADDANGRQVKRGCLTDIRADEREMCRREGATCKTCAGNDCNAKIAFQQCHVCSSTESVNCIRVPDVFPVVTCHNYLDECFTHVRDDTVVRGCASQSNSSVIDTDCQVNGVNSDYCERCKTERCNKRTVNGEFCLTCDSSTDSNCRNNTTVEMRTQCALAVRPMGCYRLEGDQDSVARGCLANLFPNERQLCRKEDDMCKTCLGNDCNAKITFQRCVACQSIGNDTVCESNAASLEQKLCKRYSDVCFTHVKHNVTTRGCLLEQRTDVRTDCLDPDLCEKCDAHDSCNEAPVAFEKCGIQEGPKHPFRLKQCDKAVKALGCYRSVDQFSGVSRRGCVSELRASQRLLCREEGDHCKTCKSNAQTEDQVCNSLDTFTRCYGCDSRSNSNCAVNPTHGMILTCAAYNDTCFTAMNPVNGRVRRGCLARMPPPFVKSCRAGDVNCSVCSKGRSACNNHSVGLERCIECDSRVDRNCIDRLHKFGSGKQCNANDPMSWQGCYLSIDNGRVRRGCVSDITDSDEKRDCMDRTGECKTCFGRLCNRKAEFQSCYHCSSETFEQCSQANSSATVICRNYLGNCVINLRRDGHIRRGCSDQFKPDELAPGGNFFRCSGSNCNGQIFPENRQRCHRCNGDDECQYLENVNEASTLQPCPLYSETDECFSLLRKRKLKLFSVC